ncbi:DUF294 nucleotidyltransferase-like domain-containing protein [Idiomarina tyrosinivorans]|nr:DUF294 nucleotidyltransferase-like domain-containing protein [Idiomarina tyrosinivorans]
MKDFLQQCPPFDQLKADELDWAISQLQSVYMNEQNANEVLRDCRPALFIVRSGVFDLRSQQGRLLERLEVGDLFGYPSLLSGRPITNHIATQQDGIVYVLSGAAFDRLRKANRDFEQYFIQAHGQRLLAEQNNKESGSDWVNQPIQQILQHAPVSIPSTTTIAAAARLMSEQQVSSLLVVDDHHLVGILTDRDIRNRVVAKGLSYEVAVNVVMTPLPAAVNARRSVLEALTTMTSHNVHHLPVVDDNEQPVGMITATDLMRIQRSEPVYLISALHKAESRQQLIAEAENLPEYLQRFADRVKDTSVVGRLMASVTDTMTRKLIQLYERDYGVAPVAYHWLAFGSQGREDQTLSSDQDNGLLYSSAPTASQEQWFAGLAASVCEGLHDCGIPLCPGNIMASNPEYRGTEQQWLARFRGWTESPTPKALMYCQIFFDSRSIMGSGRHYREYRQKVAALGQQSVFIANLAILVNQISVPLGLFNRLRTRSSEQGELIDIKRYGIAVINDIARLYALEAGLTDAATPQRLNALRGNRLLNRQDNQSLLDVWQFLTQLRLQHQLAVWGTTQAKNAIDPEQLSPMMRRQLKSAFRIIKQAQQGVGLKFGRQGY